MCLLNYTNFKIIELKIINIHIPNLPNQLSLINAVMFSIVTKFYICLSKLKQLYIYIVYILYECVGSRCIYDNLTIYSQVSGDEDETNHFVGSYCGKNIPNTLTIKNGVTMIFISDTSVSYKGFEILYELPGRWY